IAECAEFARSIRYFWSSAASANSASPLLSRSHPDVLLEPLRRGFAAVDVAVAVDRHEFGAVASGLPRVSPGKQNERVNPARLAVADADPLLPSGILNVIGLGIGDVDLILAVEGNPARLAELGPRRGERLAVLIEDLNAVVAAIADEHTSARIDRDGVNRMEFAGCPAGLAPRGHEFSRARELHDAIVAGFTVSVGDEHVAARRHRDVARRREMIRTAPFLPWCPKRHEHFAFRAELDDDLPALVAFRRPICRNGIGHPHIALLIDRQPVRPDEQAAAKTLDDFAFRTELQDRIGFRIAALISESRRILEALAAHNRPDMAAIGIHRNFSDG